MEKVTALIITFIAGLLFLMGGIIIKKVNNKEKVYKFSTALAFSVIICLIIFDLVPEILESFSNLGINKKIVYILGFTLIGIIILKILDCLVPVHNHKHNDQEKSKVEHNNHLYHIGIITSIALILHNIIEGMAIYTISISSIKLGILMCIGVGLHNIPMGMEISLALDMSHKNKFNKIITYLLLMISPFCGGLVILLFQNINTIVLGILMCLTCGMLIYISLFELYNELKINLKSRISMAGLFTGLILMLITLLI